MKFSRQRNLIFDTVVRNPIHPTAEQVYAQLKEKNPNISLGTVYRNLNLLSELGELRRINVANGCDRYDGRLDPHFHIICSKCGRVKDIERSFEADFIKEIEAGTGYRSITVDAVMTGVCADCKIN